MFRDMKINQNRQIILSLETLNQNKNENENKG